MADYIRTRVSQLKIDDAIMWRGKVCQVVGLTGPTGVKLREFKRKEVALRNFKNKWYYINDDIAVDKVSI